MSEPSNSNEQKNKGKMPAYLATPQSKNDNANQSSVPAATPPYNLEWLESRVPPMENENQENTFESHIDGPSMPETHSLVEEMGENLRHLMSEMRELKQASQKRSVQQPGLEMTAPKPELSTALQKTIIENIPLFDAKLAPTDATMARSFFFKLKNACLTLGYQDFRSQSALLAGKMANNDETINWLESVQNSMEAPQSLDEWWTRIEFDFLQTDLVRQAQTQLINKRLPHQAPNIRVYLMEFMTLWRNSGFADDFASANMLINSLNKQWFSKLKNSALFLTLVTVKLSTVMHVLQRLYTMAEEERLHAATLPAASSSQPKPAAKTRVQKVNTSKDKEQPKSTKDVSKMSHKERFVYCYEKGLCACCLSPGHRRPECPCDKCVAFRATKSTPKSTHVAAVTTTSPVVNPSDEDEDEES